jgi:hypothetical protein
MKLTGLITSEEFDVRETDPMHGVRRWERAGTKRIGTTANRRRSDQSRIAWSVYSTFNGACITLQVDQDASLRQARSR